MNIFWQHLELGSEQKWEDNLFTLYLWAYIYNVFEMMKRCWTTWPAIQKRDKRTDTVLPFRNDLISEANEWVKHGNEIDILKNDIHQTSLNHHTLKHFRR
jgi:hypothetical protein